MTPNEPLSVVALFAWARHTLGLSSRELGITVQASARTMRRWEAGTSLPRGRHRARVEHLGELRELVSTVFESPAAAEAWLHTSMRGLQGRTPLAVIRQGDVTDVVGVLATMESGAFM